LTFVGLECNLVSFLKLNKISTWVMLTDCLEKLFKTIGRLCTTEYSWHEATQ
jgi:uncharacterized protein HemY